MNTAYKYDILSHDEEFEAAVSKLEDEIKNDPFGLGKIINVKGLARMNHKVTLAGYAEELVSQYGKYSRDQYELTLDMLPEDAKNELVRLYIESIDREIEWACYGADESINSDFLCALLSMLKNNCHETRENFATVTRNNLITYYKDNLQDALDDACENYLNAQMNEQGYQFYQDLEHGDTYWSR